MTTTTSPGRQTPRPARLTRPTATALARAEYDRMIGLLAALGPDDWRRPTDCPDWDVRQLASHVVGMAAMCTSPFEMARQQRAASSDHRERGGAAIDALTALQVREREDRSPAQLLAELEKVAPRAARGRRWVPAVLRRRTFPEPQRLNGSDELWTVGYLIDVILTRDCWMHRVDLTRATGLSMELRSDHDGVIVDDVVHEWAGRHGRSCRVELTGPAGGRWSFGSAGDAESITLDAVEFCRTVSGRAPASGLLATEVPF
jgi:uncharacterized protein (TIGR03083 family)